MGPAMGAKAQIPIMHPIGDARRILQLPEHVIGGYIAACHRPAPGVVTEPARQPGIQLKHTALKVCCQMVGGLVSIDRETQIPGGYRRYAGAPLSGSDCRATARRG